MSLSIERVFAFSRSTSIWACNSPIREFRVYSELVRLSTVCSGLAGGAPGNNRASALRCEESSRNCPSSRLCCQAEAAVARTPQTSTVAIHGSLAARGAWASVATKASAAITPTAMVGSQACAACSHHIRRLQPGYSVSGTFLSSSSSQTVACASDGARQSPRGDREPPDEIFGPFGRAERLNWLCSKNRRKNTRSQLLISESP